MYKKTVSFDFLNIEETDLSHPIYEEPIKIFNDGSRLYELHDSSENGIKSGFRVKGTSYVNLLLLVDCDGYPWIYDSIKQQAISRISNFPCFINGKSVVDDRSFMDGANFRDYQYK